MVGECTTANCPWCNVFRLELAKFRVAVKKSISESRDAFDSVPLRCALNLNTLCDCRWCSAYAALQFRATLAVLDKLRAIYAELDDLRASIGTWV